MFVCVHVCVRVCAKLYMFIMCALNGYSLALFIHNCFLLQNGIDEVDGTNPEHYIYDEINKENISVRVNGNVHVCLFLYILMSFYYCCCCYCCVDCKCHVTVLLLF